MRFAAFTVSLPESSPEEAVEHLAACGYDGVEWRVVDQTAHSGVPAFWAGNRCTLPLATFERDAPAIRALCEHAGLAMPNVGAYVSCFDAADIERAMRGCVALGSPSVRVQVPRYDGRERYLDVRDRALVAFESVVAAARRHGVRALIETHMQTIVPSASAAAAFCARFPPEQVGVIHDAGNMVFEGFEHYRMGLEVLGPYLAHVHLKNALWEIVGERSDGSTRWAARFAPLTSGAVDVAALFDALAAVGYDGWVSFEDFSTARSQADRTRENLAFVREVAGGR